MWLANVTWAPELRVNYVLHMKSHDSCHGHINVLLASFFFFSAFMQRLKYSWSWACKTSQKYQPKKKKKINLRPPCRFTSPLHPLHFEKIPWWKLKKEEKPVRLRWLCRVCMISPTPNPCESFCKSTPGAALTVHLMNGHSGQTGVCTDHCNYGA